MSDCFAAGGSGYLLETLSRHALQKSLPLVRTGEKVFPSELASFIADLGSQQGPKGTDAELEKADLSPREIEILYCLASGHLAKLIAAKLDIARSTVKVHIKHILRKTRTSNRTQAAVWALQCGIVLGKPDNSSNSPTPDDLSPVDAVTDDAEHRCNPERGQRLEYAACSETNSSEARPTNTTSSFVSDRSRR